jgi:hypothetical protein
VRCVHSEHRRLVCDDLRGDCTWDRARYGWFPSSAISHLAKAAFTGFVVDITIVTLFVRLDSSMRIADALSVGITWLTLTFEIAFGRFYGRYEAPATSATRLAG